MAAATSRMTLGALFGAVTTMADTISNTVGALNDGVEMINKTISDASERQKIRSETDMAVFERLYHLEATQRVQEFQDTLEDWMDSRDGRREKYKSTFDQLQKAIEDRRQKRPA